MQSHLLLGLLAILAPAFVAAALLRAQTHDLDVGAALDNPAEAAKEAASDASSLPSYDVVIVIPSHAVQHVERRLTIRQTWMQYLNTSALHCRPCQKHKTRVVFVVGKEGSDESHIDQESEEFGDLGLLEDFSQRSTRCSAEMTQRTIRYAVEHFKFKLLVKVDVHAWVFVDRLLSFLEIHHLFEINPRLPGIYAGTFPSSEPVPVVEDANITITTNQSGVPVAQFSGALQQYVPVHAVGAGYVLSPDLCEFIAGMGAASEDTSGAPKWGDEYGWAPVPRLLRLPQEDVAVGFWLQPVNHTKVWMSVSSKNEACANKSGQDLVVDSGLNILEMKMRWFGVSSARDACHLDTPRKVNASSSFLQRSAKSAPRMELVQGDLPPAISL